MNRILVNAVSAKEGGARTIVESFVTATAEFPQHEFIILAGFEIGDTLPPNVIWRYFPKSGFAAMVFSLFGVAFFYLWFRANRLISFNNVSTLLVPTKRRLTYFHQLKALDPAFSELKLWAIRCYLRHSRERVVLQSHEVKAAFESMFGAGQRELVVAWPGIRVPTSLSPRSRNVRRALVPVTSPQSPHKNFAFIRAVAAELGKEWIVVVTAPDSAVYRGPEVTNIEFAGTLSRKKLFNEYRRATVCLMGSTHETIGLPIFEALAVGTPVVAFDAPYIRSFREYFGISKGLILAKTPKEAATRIEQIARDPTPLIEAKQDFRKADWAKIINTLEG